MNIKPIETIYNGYRFRSRAEARWAVLFDACKIQYMYEPEGFRLSDGTLYLPDFYLPESKTYFEVKGIMSDADMHKIKQLQKDLCVSIAIGYADMTFQSSDNYNWGGDQVFEIAPKDESFIVKCPNCGKIFLWQALDIMDVNVVGIMMEILYLVILFAVIVQGGGIQKNLLEHLILQNRHDLNMENMEDLATVIDFLNDFGMLKGWSKKRRSIFVKKLGYNVLT